MQDTMCTWTQHHLQPELLLCTRTSSGAGTSSSTSAGIAATVWLVVIIICVAICGLHGPANAVQR